MKKNYFILGAAITAIGLTAAMGRSDNALSGFTKGTPVIKSVSSLTFGPEGVLFIGDSQGATVFAIDTRDSKRNARAEAADIQNIDQKIAASLGTTPENVTITDMAVNPLSKKIYFAVQNSDGTPLILRLENGKLQSLPLKNVSYSTLALNNVPAPDAKDQRGRSMRVAAISDIAYADGKLMLSGISNQEFASTFRSIPYPFNTQQESSSLEIYHAAHGRYETNAPIRTFTTSTINGKNYLIASYTCTPLVVFALDDLKPGTHVKGRTVAEMGNGNTPADILTLNSGGEKYLLMANSSRPAAKLKHKDIESFQGSLTEKATSTYAGVPFEVSARKNVTQMDKLDDGRVVLIQKSPAGSTDLLTINGKDL
ncbi:hypothetical protein [Daejeonella sp.]|uniref:hypothetical protein n=1 Tax=Daejeonella sp. TaxID=2805397 RepID=UPI0030C5CD4D